MPIESLPAPPRLEMEGVSKRSRLVEQPLLDQIHLTLESNEVIMISGRSGSGKSLLLKTIAMLEPFDEGRILWNGKSIPPVDVPRFRSRVMYLRQTPSLGEGNVMTCLEAPFLLRAHSNQKLDLTRIEHQLQDLGQSDQFLRKNLAELSGGERQILQVIRALQLAPQTLLLDEPTASLDHGTTQRLESVLLHWQAESPERSLIWVSHSSDQIMRLLERSNGRHGIVERGQFHTKKNFGHAEAAPELSSGTNTS